ncbi:MAG TPA: GNAT family N-acetyltransferase [Candidatus Limnocylindrales bacterium]|jgi:GNAT superfamily N-acetyltransferase
MTMADIDAAVELARAQGWRDRRRFYEFVLRTSTCQPLVGDVDGRLMATGLATASGPIGWLGAIVVAEEFRGRGVGRTMTEELCRRLRAAGCVTLSLVATDAGRRLYERMGFRLVTSYHELEADHLPDSPIPPEGARVRRLEPADLPNVFGLDASATAEDRSVPLAVLAESEGWVLDDEDGLRGFLLPTERAHGVVVAPRFEDGLFLLDLHRHIVPPGALVRACIPEEHTAAWRELRARGWRETWQAPRLILGPVPNWRPHWIWGQINSAMG